MEKPPELVIILGGGTAGWMTANLLQRRWAEMGTAITLIELPEIGIVGVGEGSTPQLKAFFDTLGIAEAEWMPRCNATYKAGIEFAGWSDKPGHERYFHPFPTDVDHFTQGQFFYSTRARRTGRDVPAHPDPFFVQTRIAREGRAPVAPPNFPFNVGYGYHFDAHLIGAFLREFGVARGIRHVEARIASVELDEAGDVKSLVAEDGRRFEADFFVDASGFRAAIVEGALKEPHRPFGENLFNDRAVVTPTPLPPDGVQACTRSIAKSAGWIWNIPLTNRIGNGYVYSSRYIDDDAAAAELRAHLGLTDDAEVRHLKMKCGRIERSWVRNCLAVGLAQGFLEPLEATALHIVINTVESFQAWEEERRDDFNTNIARRYEGIRDYLVCHYRTAQRSDTDYWGDAAKIDALSDSLKGVMTAWFTGQDLEQEVTRQDIGKFYLPLSWHCMLAGYGNFPPAEMLKPPGPDITRFDMADVDRFVSGCAMNFPSHTQALERLKEPT